MKIMLPGGRVVTVIVDEETGLANGPWGMQAVFSGQTVKVTEAAVLWNGAEVAKLAPEVKAVEIKIVAKQLKITADKKTVLYETGF